MSHAAAAEELGRAIRDARIGDGLSQATLAKRLGVSRVTIGRLERGEDVSMKTALAALRICGMRLETVDARGWLTAYEHSRAIGSELDNDDHSFALRLLRQALEDLDYLIERVDQRALETFFAREPNIDDPRWDGFFKLALRERSRRGHITAPNWAQSAPLPEPFFPARPSRRFIGRTIEQTSASFAHANVWIDERDLAYA
jgi:HTH-type transcriptional regulator/antitoxin HipB